MWRTLEYVINNFKDFWAPGSRSIVDNLTWVARQSVDPAGEGCSGRTDRASARSMTNLFNWTEELAKRLTKKHHLTATSQTTFFILLKANELLLPPTYFWSSNRNLSHKLCLSWGYKLKRLEKLVTIWMILSNFNRKWQISTRLINFIKFVLLITYPIENYLTSSSRLSLNYFKTRHVQWLLLEAENVFINCR